MKRGVVMGYNPYIPWDVSLFYDASINLREVMGTAFNIGFWIFIIVVEISFVIKVINNFIT